MNLRKELSVSKKVLLVWTGSVYFNVKESRTLLLYTLLGESLLYSKF